MPKTDFELKLFHVETNQWVTFVPDEHGVVVIPTGHYLAPGDINVPEGFELHGSGETYISWEIHQKETNNEREPCRRPRPSP